MTGSALRVGLVVPRFAPFHGGVETYTAQAAAALALYLRAGQTPPSGLVNATTKDTQANADVKSVFLTPTWVCRSASGTSWSAP